ncbi:MAG: hypothetical protein Q9191_007701 [Dirinaria sp. TL-2023a]
MGNSRISMVKAGANPDFGKFLEDAKTVGEKSKVLTFISIIQAHSKVPFDSDWSTKVGVFTEEALPELGFDSIYVWTAVKILSLAHEVFARTETCPFESEEVNTEKSEKSDTFPFVSSAIERWWFFAALPDLRQSWKGSGRCGDTRIRRDRYQDRLPASVKRFKCKTRLDRDSSPRKQNYEASFD